MRGYEVDGRWSWQRTRSWRPWSHAGEIRAPADLDLPDLTKDELYERAKARDVSGRSGMTKKQLIEAPRRSA